MIEMFDGATASNQEIPSLDTSNFTDMFGMFDGVSAYNQESGKCEMNA
jgi:hypothetical protein